MTHTPNAKNAPGGGAATPASTEGVHMPTQPNQEDMMTKSNPDRPWLDTRTAAILTEADLASLDRTANLTTFVTGIDRDEYMRAQADNTARIRQYVGPHDVALPAFVKLPNRYAEWELTPQRNDAVRYLDAEHVDVGTLTACLEANQHALSGHVDTVVRIDVGETSDPAELVNWALDLLALADRWKQIRATEGR